MFCPSCKSEFRPRFTRCASCDVDLVDDLSAVTENKEAAEPSREPSDLLFIQVADVCGYFELDEARQARNRLHENDIVAEIAIRTSPETPPGGAIIEEYWLRADAKKMRQVAALIENAPEPKPEPEPEQGGGTFKCSNCGRPVREEETFCANCGMRFSE